MPKSRSFEEIESAIVAACEPLYEPDQETSSYYAPYYVNLRENARRVIGSMPFADRIAFATYAFAKRWSPDQDGKDETLWSHAMDAAEYAIMLSLAFEDTQDATQARVRSAFVLESMADNNHDVTGLRMPDHWRDDALRTVIRDMELIATAQSRGLQSVAA